MRVLLIEDDGATAQSIELMLKSESFNVYTTDLGEEGIVEDDSCGKRPPFKTDPAPFGEPVQLYRSEVVGRNGRAGI